MRPRTPVMAFLTDATPAHEFGNMKDPLPPKTTMLSLSITPDTASMRLRTMAPWCVTRLGIDLAQDRLVHSGRVIQ